MKVESTVMNGQSMYPCVECGQFNLRSKKKYTDIFLRTSWMKYCERCAIATRGKWITKNYEVKQKNEQSKKRKRMDEMIERCTKMTEHVDDQIQRLEYTIQQLRNLKECLKDECDETKAMLESN